jgi:site-specific recombinase XerD
VPELDVDHLGPQEILDFLHDLEVERHNIAATRNVRLAAIHAFFRYCAAEHPERIEHCQRVLAVPFKRARSRPVEYLEFAEIQAVLAAIDRSTTNGRRDYALLASMFNTGARVQEIVALRVSIFAWSRHRIFVSSGRGARNASARSGHRPLTSCVRFSPNAAPTKRELTNHSLLIIMVSLSRDSACATS